ncbi:MAG: GNAT family N-acetyltransferase [Kiritimatiellae bacterium]|nr:GNAT family N-acetyltransferase [Kiritimatiellia bacterium]
MNIRRARSSDMPRLLELLRQVNNVHADGRPDLFKHDRTKYTADELETLVTDDAKPIFVSVDDNGLVLGYAFCRFEVEKGDGNLVPGKDLYIDDICFDENFRGRGLAKELFAWVEDFARKEGCRRITLHVWECNPIAAAFYAGRGMKSYFTALEKTIR